MFADFQFNFFISLARQCLLETSTVLLLTGRPELSTGQNRTGHRWKAEAEHKKSCKFPILKESFQIRN